MHRLPERMLEQRIRVVVVGCGGTGSAIAGALPYLHQSLLAFGHPFGLDVTLVDGDTVSETNCVRQPFSRAEVGHSKAVILATRLNLFWGLEWGAVHGHLGEVNTPPADLVIGCVDTRRARRAILDRYRDCAAYWLDFGNDAYVGQFVLGEPTSPRTGTVTVQQLDAGWEAREVLEGLRLPTAADLWPELVDPALDEDDGPSCSAVEALTRQAPFVNQVLAHHGLALLGRLFRHGEIAHHGAWVNLATGRVSPIPVPEPPEVGEDAAAPAPVERGEAAA